jgi:vacuolar-type H+-ATPase subunit C/Vma6
MNLIEDREDRGYPTEYLLARMKGRHAYFLNEWTDIIFHADPLDYLHTTQYGEFIETHSVNAVWIRLLKEFQWVFFQMNKGMRDVFVPFFACCEIKTLIACFRYKTERGTGTETEGLLLYSLLAKKIKEIVMANTDLTATLEVFEKKILPLEKRSGRLLDALSRGGLAAVERKLTGSLLENIIASTLNPVIRNYFTWIIDIKNIISVYKHIKWDIAADPPLISGGSIRKSAMKRLMQTRELSSLSQLVERMTGMRVEELHLSNMESVLYTALSKRIRALTRENSDAGCILDYLWKTYIEVQNLSIIIHGRNIERDTLRGELIGL